VLGAGTTILGAININSGATLTTNSNVGTIAVNGGMWNHAAGTVASPSLQGNGRLTYTSAGAISGTMFIGPGCTADFSQDPQSRVVANVTMQIGSSLLDPNKTVTFSNPIYLSECGIEDVSLRLGKDVHVQRS
ncbi:MAG: hypothetical protein ACREQ5_05615, partial [Candidatus Dormibacteria bacterium]